MDESVAIDLANEFNVGKVLGKAYYFRADNGDGVTRLVYDDGVSSVFLNETLD